MAKTFFCIKRGDHLSLGSLPGKSLGYPLIDSPRPFSTSTPGALMRIKPIYEGVPYPQEKLTIPKNQLLAQRRSVNILEASSPQSEDFFAARDWLRILEKNWADITEGQPCL